MTNTTDKSILTAAGKALLAQLNAEEKPLVIDKMIFANVPNRPEFPQPDDVVPSDDVVHEAAVEQRGRLSVDSVIYSTTLTSQEGPFEFNWTGAYCSEYGVLVTIDHHALTPKSADEPGVAGNTLVRSVVLEYKDIAEITNITVDASTWQYNATPRMKKMDDDVAQAIIDQNGKDWFIEDGFLVTPQASAFNIKAGVGYVSGNRVTLEFDRNVQVPNKPSFIYVDAHREGTPTGEQVTLFDFVITADEKDDYTDANGVKHFVCKIAQVLGDGSVSDLRPEGQSADKEWVQKSAKVVAKKAMTPRTFSEYFGDTINVKCFGAVGDGVTDDTAAIRAAYNAMSNGDRLFFPLPDVAYAVRAETDASLLLWDKHDCFCEMLGYLKWLPNSEGFVGGHMIHVTGNNNQFRVNMHNIDQVPTKLATELKEYHNTGIYLAGKGNRVKDSKVWNFTAPYRIGKDGSSNNQIVDSFGTVTDRDNFAWTNDIVVVWKTSNAIVRNVVGAVYDETNPYGITLVNNPKRETARCRVGITLDADAEGCIVDSCIVGEGFSVGIHSEGTGERRNIISNNIIHSQKRNAINGARGALQIYGNLCYPVLNLDYSNPTLAGAIGSVTSNVIVKDNVIISDRPDVIGVRVLDSVTGVVIENNSFIGDFELVVQTGAIIDAAIRNNTHSGGVAKRLVSTAKLVSATQDARVYVEGNAGIVSECGIATYSMPITFKDNTLRLVEGYTGDDGVVRISGKPTDGGLNPAKNGHVISGNTVVYLGTTPITGKNFVQSLTTGQGPNGMLTTNYFDAEIFTQVGGGNYWSDANWIIGLNSVNSIESV